MVEVRSCTTAELEAAPNLAELVAEYAHESSIAELGPCSPQIATYRALEAAGFLHPIGAFVDGALQGFILPVVIVLPHYGALAGTVESFFVTHAARKKGLGDRLRKGAQRLASALGAKALLMSAPVGGALDRALDANKLYRHSNNVYVMALQ